MKTLPTMTACLLMLGTLALPGAAQEADRSTTLEQELRELATAPTAEDADRATVRRFLANDRVRSVAESMGVDADELAGQAGTLESHEAADLAERIRGADESPLAGGDTFVITSTTIIIVLLILILVAVA